MNFSDDSPMPASPSSGPTLTLILSLRIPGKIPSWNAILAMEHWGRSRLKKQIQDEFISALSLSENASSTLTICAKNTISTVSDIAELFREMSRTKSRSKPPSAKPPKVKRSTHKSKLVK